MSIWQRISDAVAALAAGESLARVFDRLRGPRERGVAFTIAVIGLGAKMAKADGTVTRNEVAAFREVFHIAPEDEASAARVFNLARQDVAGFEDYARSIRAMFAAGDRVLCDLMEGLFHIAMADGTFHPDEDRFLGRVRDIFELDDRQYRALRARFVPDAEPDPYEVLGLDPGASAAEAKKRWRQLVRDSHPDRMVARGVPPEAVRLAERRLVAINRAYEEITGDAA
ncbi:DnaJ like chaperone protein [Palleronia salina]|uniref:DnaJ like chaperone protein n=1 Tax=Palleronia salina TaxID=313368 RepID=A0A1M6FNZ6_9RHOB|nr:molecular chaperone DjiA [Palleronia salina]SHI99400.1 DnaJ like chaperone protein [Palleronia salina]